MILKGATKKKPEEQSLIPADIELTPHKRFSNPSRNYLRAAAGLGELCW